MDHEIEICSLLESLQLQAYLRRRRQQSRNQNRNRLRSYHVCERRCFHEFSELQQLHIKSLFGYACARETRNGCTICRYPIEANECYYIGKISDFTDSIQKWKESRGIF